MVLLDSTGSKNSANGTTVKLVMLVLVPGPLADRGLGNARDCAAEKPISQVTMTCTFQTSEDDRGAVMIHMRALKQDFNLSGPGPWQYKARIG